MQQVSIINLEYNKMNDTRVENTSDVGDNFENLFDTAQQEVAQAENPDYSTQTEEVQESPNQELPSESNNIDDQPVEPTGDTSQEKAEDVTQPDNTSEQPQSGSDKNNFPSQVEQPSANLVLQPIAEVNSTHSTPQNTVPTETSPKPRQMSPIIIQEDTSAETRQNQSQNTTETQKPVEQLPLSQINNNALDQNSEDTQTNSTDQAPVGQQETSDDVLLSLTGTKDNITNLKADENLEQPSIEVQNSLKNQVAQQNSPQATQVNEVLAQAPELQNDSSFQQNNSRQNKGQGQMLITQNEGVSNEKNLSVQSLFDTAKTGSAQDIDMQQNIDRVVKAVRTNIGRGSSVVQLRLDPPELGTLRIEIKFDDSGANLLIQATNTKAQQLLQRNIQNLRTSLEASGIQTNQIEVQLRLDLRNDSPNDQQSGDGDSSQQGQQFQEQFQSPDQGTNNQFDQSEFSNWVDMAEEQIEDDAALAGAELSRTTQWSQLEFDGVDLMV